jgi:hypothetical protein
MGPPGRRGRVARKVVFVVFVVFGGAVLRVTSAAAQPPAPCVTDTLNADFPGAWMGTTIGQVTVRARNVEMPVRPLAGLMQFVHRPTQVSVAQNELSFAPGQVLDSLQLLESVRRLRRTQLFSEVLLEGTRCGNGPEDLTIWTRDAWSLRGSARVAEGSNSRIALSEVNLLGTARTITLAREVVDDRSAFSAGVIDPYFFNTRLRAAGLLRNYADGRAWSWSVRTREMSPEDTWRAVLMSRQLRRLTVDDPALPLIDILRRDDALVVSRLVSLTKSAAYAVEVGAEHQRAQLSVARAGTLLGKSDVQRQFTGPLLGMTRQSLRFDALDWLVPGQAMAELPVGLEGDVAFSVGRLSYDNAMIAHFDGWIGATGMPSRWSVLTGDVWSSGYWTRDSLSNGTLRMLGAVYLRAPRGLWILRASSERLYNPDPDVFALSTVDPLLRILAPRSRLAESALSVTAERSLHLYSTEGRWALDGAVFASYSERHRTVDGSSGDVLNLGAATIGIGLRQVRSQPTQAPIRLDIGRAVWRTRGLPDRWIISFSTTPWISAGRMRDGLREAR